MDKIKLFSQKNNLTILGEECLRKKISIPASDTSSSVYNLLFEQSESDYPY
ncbi:hypothetical protein [Wukongibacter baidiensis]